MARNNNAGPFSEVPKQLRGDPAQIVPPTPIVLQDVPYSEFVMDEQAEHYLKNIPYGKALELAGLIDYAPGQVASKTFVQNSRLGMTIFAMSAGEGISAHKSSGDAFVTVLEGKGKFTIDDISFVLEKGQCVVMPARHPHAVSALENFKMLLVVVFPESE